MAETTITRKGQVVIPASIRKKRHIKPGQRFSVVEKEEKIILTPIRSLTIEEAKGWLKTKKTAQEMLKEARKKDRQREARLK